VYFHFLCMLLEEYHVRFWFNEWLFKSYSVFQLDDSVTNSTKRRFQMGTGIL